MCEDKAKGDIILSSFDVEQDVIVGFLEIIRDKYPLVDKANYFLERHVGVSGINIAIANQRDFVSHFCTVLRDKSLSYEERKGQLSAAEEHIRRAIIESYQKAVSIKLEKSLELFERYKVEVLPVVQEHDILKNAPSAESIKAILNNISSLTEKGRAAKAQNNWNEKFEDGIEALIEAFQEVVGLIDSIEEYIIRYGSISNAAVDLEGTKKQLFYGRWGLKIGIAGFIVGVFGILNLFHPLPFANSLPDKELTLYFDNDGDGFGNPVTSIHSKIPVDKFVLNSDDCDDSNKNININANEICDKIDNNCNHQVDEVGDCNNVTSMQGSSKGT